MTSKIDFVSNIVLPLATAIVTIVLFFTFQPYDCGALFYVNLCYTLLLEAIFWGWFGLLRSGGQNVSVAFKAAMGVVALYYIMVGVGIMLVYGLVLSSFIGLKWYISALVIVTLLWIIFSTLFAQTDTHYKQTVDRLAEDTYTLNFLTRKVEQIGKRCEAVYADRGISYKTSANLLTPVDKLKNKIAYLTPNVLQNIPSMTQLNTIISRCEECVDGLEYADEAQLAEAEKKLIRYIDTAVSDIDFIKNTTRR